jgi:hypothetical protein
MTQQLSALGLINTSVLSVGEALGAYLKAQTAIDQENLRYTAQLASEQATSAAAIAAAAVVAAAASGPAAAANTTFAQFLQGSIHNPSNDPGFLDRGGGGAATGGFRTTGAVMVGELGREVVDFDTPGRVYTADQTRGMFANRSEELSVMREVSNKLDLVIDSIRRGDVAHLQQLTTVAAKLKKFDNDGMPPVRA